MANADLDTIQEEIARDEEGVTDTITDKAGELYTDKDGNPCTITVLGSEAKRVRLAREKNQRRIARLGKGTVEPEEQIKSRVAYCSAAVVGWSGWMRKGEAMECTPDNVKALLQAEHILSQVEMLIHRHATFFAKS